MKMVKLLTFIFIFFAVSAAKADEGHCTPGDTTPEWRQCHDDWWDCERRVEALQDAYVGCVGGQQSLFDILGWGKVQANPGITGYVIPQHPVETALNDLVVCNAHLSVCLIGEFQFYHETFQCLTALNSIKSQYFGL